MPKYGYSAKVEDPCARAYGKEMRVSPKDSVAVCRAIKGKSLSAAKELLEDVKLKKRAVPYHTHNKKLAHKKGIGSGAYPVKAAGEIMKVLKNAEENATYKGLNLEKLKVVHASAYKGITMLGMIPRAFGRSSPFNKPLTNVEIILKEAS
jgi:large subunit ribosomal protein L22